MLKKMSSGANAGALAALVALLALSSRGAQGKGDSKIVVKGVPRSQQGVYTELQSKNQFKCKEGGRIIPFTYVNDDYCDCADGSDEPGTSACQQSRFYCRNKGHVGAYIASSRVGDGLCDCCDGSDEAAGVCPNNCKQLAAETRAKKAEQIRLLEQGAAKKLTYIEAGKKAIAERDAEYEKLKASVDAQEEAMKAARSTKTEAEKAEAEKQTAAIAAQVERMKTSLKVGELGKDGLEKLYKQLKGRYGDVVSELREQIKEAGGITDEEPTAPGHEEEEAEEEGEEGHEEHDVEHEEPPLPEPPAEEVVESLPEEVLTQLQEAETAADVKTEEAESARKVVSDMETSLGKDRNRLRELEKSREKDYGPESELWVLQGKCFSKTINQYVYEMCPFDVARQKEGSSSGGTSLGRWDRLEREGAGFRFFFTDGQKCWNGPERSLSVTVRCGVDDEVLSVDEPSMCTYEMDFATPAACDSQHSKQLKLDLDEEAEEEDGPRSEL